MLQNTSLAPKRASAPRAVRGPRLALRFALREMRAGLKGFYVFIACIALGVGAIVGVGSLSQALIRGVAEEGQTILGGDISFRLAQRPASAEERSFLEELGTVSQTTTMRAMARDPVSGDQSLVELKAVDDAYPLYGELEIDGGVRTALRAPDAALVEPALLTRLGLTVGDALVVGHAQLTVVGTVVAEPDKLAEGIEFGPRLMIGPQALAATGLVQPGSVVRWSYRVRLPGIEDASAVERAIAAVQARFPQAGWEIRSRANAAPGLQRNIERLAQFLTLVGLTALAVGGVGVANAVQAFLDGKRDTIATFKCLGASGGFVFAVYLLQILMLAALGIGLGLGVGLVLPVAAGFALQEMLPVKAVFGVFPRELGYGVVYGFLMALAFAIWPLGRAHDIAPGALFRGRTAAHFGWPRKRYIAATAGLIAALAALAVLTAFDRRVAAIYVVGSAASFVMLLVVARLVMLLARLAPRVRTMELRLAIGNMHRPGSLTPSVVLSLGLGLTLLVALSLIDANLRRDLSGRVADAAPTIFILDIQNNEKTAFDAFLEKIAPDGIVESAPMLRGRITALAGVPVEEIEVNRSAWVLRGDRGVTYSATLPDNAIIAAGAWWPADYDGPPLVSFTEEEAVDLGLAVGDEVAINILGRPTVATIANIRSLEWESLGINFVMVFSPNTFAGAPHAHLATLTFPELEPDAARDAAIVRAIGAKFPTVTAVRVREAIDTVNALIAQLAWAVRAAASVTLIASVLVLGGALAAGHRGRIADAAVLKMLGATRGRVVASHALEYALLGLATAIFALLAGGVAARFVITDIMGGAFTLLPGTAVSAVGVALALSVGLGLIGTWRTLGRKAAPILREI